MKFPNANKYTITPNNQQRPSRPRPQYIQNDSSESGQQPIHNGAYSKDTNNANSKISFLDIVILILIFFGPGILIFALCSWLVHPYVGIVVGVYCTYKIFKAI